MVALVDVDEANLAKSLQFIAQNNPEVNTSAIKTYTGAVLAATTKAKTSCAAKVSPTTVRLTYMAAIKAAQDKLKSDLKALDNLGGAIKPLIDAHKAALDKAAANFKSAMEKARADLKTALGTN